MAAAGAVDTSASVDTGEMQDNVNYQCNEDINSNNNSYAVVEFHWFRDNYNNHIIKELAFASYGEQLTDWKEGVFHYQPPYNLCKLNDDKIRHVLWLTKHYHLLPWDCGSEKFSKNQIRNLLSKYKIVYTKGEEKRRYLSRFHNDVRDLPHRWKKPIYNPHTNEHCKQHRNNYGRCALTSCIHYREQIENYILNAIDSGDEDYSDDDDNDDSDKKAVVVDESNVKSGDNKEEEEEAMAAEKKKNEEEEEEINEFDYSSVINRLKSLMNMFMNQEDSKASKNEEEAQDLYNNDDYLYQLTHLRVLAQNGFYYCHKNDAIKCFWCENPLEFHIANVCAPDYRDTINFNVLVPHPPDASSLPQPPEQFLTNISTE